MDEWCRQEYRVLHVLTALNAERRVNAGAGMLTGNALVGDEERGP